MSALIHGKPIRRNARLTSRIGIDLPERVEGLTAAVDDEDRGDVCQCDGCVSAVDPRSVAYERVLRIISRTIPSSMFEQRAAYRQALVEGTNGCLDQPERRDIDRPASDLDLGTSNSSVRVSPRLLCPY
jgi:hypothetical protein